MPALFLSMLVFFSLAAAISQPPVPKDSSARDAEDPVEMADQVVTATRTTRKITEIPRAVNVVDGHLLGERMPRTSAEALREEGGIQVQKTEHGGGNAIIRGMGSSQVLLLVDGMRLNNSTYRSGNHPYLTTVDFGILERMEVVRGPGSTLYGSDAMGGTVNLITRNPTVGDSGFRVRSRAHARFASADLEKIVRTEVSLSGPRFGILAGAGLKDAGDLKRGENALPWGQGPVISPVTQSPSGYFSRDFDAKAVYAPVRNHRFILGWQSTSRPEIPRFDRYEINGNHLWNYTDQNRDMASLQFDRSGPGISVPVKAFASYHLQEEGREIQNTPTSNITREWGEAVTFGFGTQAGRRLGKHAFTAGAEAYLDRVESGRTVQDPSTLVMTPRRIALYPDGSSYDSYAGYLQDELKIGPVSITAGGRFSWVRMEYEIPYDSTLALNFGKKQKDFPAFTGNLGAVYLLRKDVYLTGSIAQGFRVPNLADVARTGESRTIRPGVIGFEIPNPALKPEKILAYEIGTRWDNNRIKSNLFWFYSALTDALDTRTDSLNGDTNYVYNSNASLVVSKQNVGKTYITGLEADARLRLYSKVWMHGNYTYTFGHNTSLDEPASGIPPAFGLFGVKWSDEYHAVDLYSRFAGDMNRLSSADQGDARIPSGGSIGWVTANLRGEWFPRRSIKIRAAVENILDINYREHGSGINAPGRNFIAGLEWSP